MIVNYDDDRPVRADDLGKEELEKPDWDSGLELESD